MSKATLPRDRITVLLAILGPGLWLFRRVLWESEVFVFRDAAHYYYPLFQWIDSLWRSGQLPFWNSLENLGVPQAADVTSSVFYPGKTVFLLPLEFHHRYTIYIVAHLIGSAVACYFLARRWGISVMGSGFAAFSYAYGGSVLSQHCNVVYLVGATWLPAALWATDRLLTQRRKKHVVLLSCILAMIVLGGDPQCVYHIGLVAGLYFWLLRRRIGWRWRSRRSVDDATTGRFLGVQRNDSPSRLFSIRNRFLLLTACAVATFCLAAIQVLPSAQWTRHGSRVAFENPRSLFEVPPYVVRSPAQTDSDTIGHCISSGLLGKPFPNTHHERAFQFSIGPWRWAELIFPNIGGRPFPVHRRWFSAIPAEGRVWTPTLYQGLLPAILGLAGLCFRKKSDKRTLWMSWIFLLATLGALGGYGMGWLIAELEYAFGTELLGQSMGHQVGGLYWLMTVVLPGYVLFRYPAKLFTFASLALSVLAARQWDLAWRDESRFIRRILAWISMTGGIATVIAVASGTTFRALLVDRSTDALFGPLDVVGAHQDLVHALIHTTIVAALLCSCFAVARKRAHWVKILALLLCSLELTVAQRWLLPSAPQGAWNTPSSIATAVRADLRHNGIGTPECSIFRAPSRLLVPQGWSAETSTRRQFVGLLWDRDTLFPKHHLSSRMRLIEAPGSMRMLEYETVMDAARGFPANGGHPSSHPHRSVLNALGAKYLIEPENQRLDETDLPRIQFAGTTGTDRIRLLRNEQAMPRAWMVQRIERLPPLASRDPRLIRQRTEEVFFPDGGPRNFRRSAVVECSDMVEMYEGVVEGVDRDPTRCTITHASATHMEIRVSAEAEGLLVLSDFYYPGWTATIHSQPDSNSRRVPILRTNRIMRGVIVPKGQHLVVFRYRPKMLYAGALVSLCSWMALACLMLRTLLTKH